MQASNESVTLTFIEEEENIDRERIFHGHLVPSEYFCLICKCLLWKPRSCSSCQHLFCQKCIHMWIKRINICPFCRQLFEEKRCPSYVQSLLSRINIHCKNSQFGCTKILSYDRLEHHENVECKYLSKTCGECEQLVLVSRMNEHREVEGLCIPRPIKCTVCKNFLDKSIFVEHFHECWQERINKFRQNPSMKNQEKNVSRLPTNLKGIDAVKKARERNSGNIYHILIMLRFLVFNWKKFPFFLIVLTTNGLFSIGTFIVAAYTFLTYWIATHIYCRVVILIFFPYFLTYGSSIIFQMISDTTIIVIFELFLFLCGCSNYVSLEVLEMENLFHRPIFSIILCFIGIILMKIVVLFLRFLSWLIPGYALASLITLINFYIYNQLKTHCIFICKLTQRRNREIMFV